MADIIQLLPDSVANQIAAGEVVQRPASVIKELVENSIDSGATDITIKIVDAGRTSIHIIDNGSGMSDTDARMAFERHATSKIRSAKDIFAITSMGFRGEALASIAAVAHVELKTKKADSELGTRIVIKGSAVEIQEPISFQDGTSFQVKNLFYNIPARRKFLKSNQTEFKYALSEIYNTALGNCDISFTIYKDNELYAKFPKSNLKQRIITIFGKRFEKGLLPVESETSIIIVKGFVGTPEMAKKNNYDQYFFVNNRFFKQRSFQAAVMRAYENLIPSRDFPPFFLFLEVDPALIDVNIHPTKTEIKFVDEYNISQIIESGVKHTLGKSNIVPSMDFMDDSDYSDMFDGPAKKAVSLPKLDVNPNYNPFGNSKSTFQNTSDPNLKNWEKLFEDFENTPEPDIPERTFASALNTRSEGDYLQQTTCFQVQKKYIVTQGKSGLLIIDIKRAHSRILYEQFLKQISQQQKPIQKTLIPIQIETNFEEAETLLEILPELQLIGFDIEEFGKNTFVINGCPSEIEISQVESVLRDFIVEFNDNHTDIKQGAQEQVARLLAKSSSMYRNVVMQQDQMQAFIAQLFQCESHSLSAEGKLAVILMEYDEIFKKFNY